MRWLLFLLMLFIIVPASAIQISEIMYNPLGSDDGHEWIEIYNNDSAEVNLTGWKFVESGTNHGVSIVNGSELLAAGAYAIIADNSGTFLQDYPAFAGTLFDSSFDLLNTGEYLALKDSNSTVVENITYADTAAEGKSLQFVSGNWCEGVATPGLANSCTTNTTPPPDEEEGYDLKLEVKIENATQGIEAKNLFKLTNLDYETNQEYMNVTVEFTIRLDDKVEYEDEFTVEFKQSKSVGTGEWTPESFGTYEICGEITDAPFDDPEEDNNDDCADIEVFENLDAETISEDDVEATDLNLSSTEGEQEATLQSPPPRASNKSSNDYAWQSNTTPNVALWLFAGVLLVIVVSLLLTLINFKKPRF